MINYTWTEWDGPDVLFGGGAENFLPGKNSYKGQDYYKLFADNGYGVSFNKTSLEALPNDERALGVFSVSTMSTWLDRNVYTANLYNKSNSPDGSGGDADDQPGLKEMTLKAIDILTERSGEDGWFLMSEAASVDKQMHTLDYDRALGELLELDDTVRATIEKLKKLGELEDTLIIVTADHGHGFDVTGSVDTKYLAEQEDDRAKRNAVGYYQNSGLSQYTVGGAGSLRYSEGVHFPARWDPRYTLHAGLGANPDHREDYKVHKEGPRKPAVEIVDGSDDYYVNYKDAVSGFVINGTLPVEGDQGVHSLTDVPVFAQGPCQHKFGGKCYIFCIPNAISTRYESSVSNYVYTGVYNSIDIFFNIADCLGLSQTNKKKHGH